MRRARIANSDVSAAVECGAFPGPRCPARSDAPLAEIHNRAVPGEWWANEPLKRTGPELPTPALGDSMPFPRRNPIRRRRRKQPKPWTLANLCAECWAAPTVFLALVALANRRGSVIVTPTRPDLSALTGITRLPTISAALSALHAANWIQRFLIPSMNQGKRTRLLRIVICRNEHNALLTDIPAVTNGTRSNSKTRHAFVDFPNGKGAANAAAPSTVARGRPLRPGTGSANKGTNKCEVPQGVIPTAYDPHADSKGPLYPIADLLKGAVDGG